MNRCLLRLMPPDYQTQFLEYFFQPCRQFFPAGLNTTGIHIGQLVAPGLNQTVAGTARTGIYTKNQHKSIITPTMAAGKELICKVRIYHAGDSGPEWGNGLDCGSKTPIGYRTKAETRPPIREYKSISCLDYSWLTIRSEILALE